MENGQLFTDYYALLQVNSTCDAKMLEKAYRHFAQMYHPDHADTADVEKFQEIIEAYKVLRDPELRAEYDAAYKARRKDNFFEFVNTDDFRVEESSAIDDAEAHQKILYLLYKRRREHADDPGILGFYLQESLGCSDETFEFHSWYLKSKGFIERTEAGTLAITIEGVDHVISFTKANEAAKLLTSEASRSAN
ncbi:DnaJ domain-containing protein [Erythrobacter ani]|uniref:DnaJ domain-containing protein n=1 Tax=Erythrobacter ani TaxID=2827235 RepID=A0ABS6SNL4_9SPHN|nr:DnaJ domain-containing protein [Erythrobacter ani]MBV7266621.1 DnaJ domain-containing protein [Erythrobacter ani]